MLDQSRIHAIRRHALIPLPKQYALGVTAEDRRYLNLLKPQLPPPALELLAQALPFERYEVRPLCPQ